MGYFVCFVAIIVVSLPQNKFYFYPISPIKYKSISLTLYACNIELFLSIDLNGIFSKDDRTG